jgi:hypothetical protein
MMNKSGKLRLVNETKKAIFLYLSIHNSKCLYWEDSEMALINKVALIGILIAFVVMGVGGVVAEKGQGPLRNSG